MADRPAPQNDELSELVARVQHLKAEHDPLLRRIQADAGMSPAVRRELVEHLEQEEAEVIRKMALVAPDVAARYSRHAMVGVPPPTPPADAADRPSRLTVGSLRADAGQPALTRVGSLRRR